MRNGKSLTLGTMGTLLAMVGLFLGGCGPAANGTGCGCPMKGNACCCAGGGLKTPRVALTLPAGLQNPDGMNLDAQNNIILSIVNVDKKLTGKLMKITPAGAMEEYFTPPANPQTGRTFPLGNAFGSDGNLYLADCQAIGGNEGYINRLLKITIQNGKPVKCESVVEGTCFANGVACYGDMVYFTESKFEGNPAKGPMPSGVYGFKLSELSGDKPIVLEKGGKDKHLVCQFNTQNQEWRVGANGIGFSPEGVMYVCNFGDKQLLAFTLNKEGTKAVSSKVVAEGGPMLCTDGLKVDAKTGLVYIADFLGSAVHCVNPANGKVRTIAKSPASDGKAGQLKKCSEVCLRDGKMYVANINLPLDGNVPGDTYVVSVIDLNSK